MTRSTVQTVKLCVAREDGGYMIVFLSGLAASHPTEIAPGKRVKLTPEGKVIL